MGKAWLCLVSMPDDATPSIAVIGAGVSGLSCANRLAEAGAKVVVLEKSRSLGGRLATRCWRDHIVDHGAPFINAEAESFRRVLLSAGWQAITAPITNPEGNVMISTTGERFYGPEGNNRLGKRLAEELHVRLETTVAEVKAEGDGVLVDGARYDALVSTAPWPQTARLLGLEESVVRYEPCLTVFYEYRLPWKGLLKERFGVIAPESPAAWSSCENHKVGRIQEGSVVMVVQASPTFSRDFLEASPEVYVPKLCKAAALFWDLEGQEPEGWFAHRWRFARNVGLQAAAPALPAGVFLGGDSHVASRLEDVWYDGRETAEAVLAWCRSSR